MDSSAFQRRVVFIRPAPETLSADGEMVPAGEPVMFDAWAHWAEKQGGESLREDQDYESDSVEITTWWTPSFTPMNSRWSVQSETGEVLDIVSVTEAVPNMRNWQIKIRAVRRQ